MSMRSYFHLFAVGLMGVCATASAQTLPSTSPMSQWVAGAKAAASGTAGGALSAGNGATGQQTGVANVHASRMQQTNLSQSMQLFASAVGRFAYTAGAQIPWNQAQSTTPIQYAPLQIAVPSKGFSGNAQQACNFQTAGGAALPSPLNGAVNLATLSYTPSGTHQASALATALQSPQSYLPSGFGATWNGVFCATVQYTFTSNGPSSTPDGSMSIANWYVPGTEDNSNVTVTQVNATYEAAKNLATGVAKPLSGAAVFYGGGAAQSWVQVQ